MKFIILAIFCAAAFSQVIRERVAGNQYIGTPVVETVAAYPQRIATPHIATAAPVVAAEYAYGAYPHANYGYESVYGSNSYGAYPTAAAYGAFPAAASYGAYPAASYGAYPAQAAYGAYPANYGTYGAYGNGLVYP